jgi:flagellar biosynthesis protein FliR
MGEITLYGVGVWAGMLVFARVAGLIMLLPGFGEPSVPPRIRLAFALLLTVVIAPTMADKLPAPPTQAWALAGMVIGETVIGVMLGGAARFLVTALATAGQAMGLETGIAFAQTADPTMTQSGQLMAVFLGIMGLALIFATGLDHMFLAGIVGSYQLVAPGAPVPLGDAAHLALDTMATSFLVGFQLAAPVIAAGLIFRLGMGVLSRLIPSIQVFFVVLPLQLMGGFVVIALGLSSGMLVWLDSIERYAKTMGG